MRPSPTLEAVPLTGDHRLYGVEKSLIHHEYHYYYSVRSCHLSYNSVGTRDEIWVQGEGCLGAKFKSVLLFSLLDNF